MFKYILIIIVGIMLYLDSTHNKQINNELDKYKPADIKDSENKSASKEKTSQK